MLKWIEGHSGISHGKLRRVRATVLRKLQPKADAGLPGSGRAVCNRVGQGFVQAEIKPRNVFGGHGQLTTSFFKPCRRPTEFERICPDGQRKDFG